MSDGGAHVCHACHAIDAIALALACTAWHLFALRYRALRHILPVLGPALAFAAGREVSRLECAGNDAADSWRFLLPPFCSAAAYAGLVLGLAEYLRRRAESAGRDVPAAVVVESV